MNSEYSRQFWDVLSPFFASVFWFEHVENDSADEEERSESLSSSASSSSTSSCVEARSARRLVLHYEARKSQALEQYGQYKHYKWGEHEFCELELEPGDFTLDLPMLDRISLLFPTTDSLTQYARAYSTFLADQWLKRRTSCGLLWLRITNGERFSMTYPRFLIELTSRNADGGQHSGIQLFSFHSLTEILDQMWFKELGVPKAVQEALDFAYTVSSRAGQAIEALIPPACPKRRSSCTSESLQALFGCHRRFLQELMQNIDTLQPEETTVVLPVPEADQRICSAVVDQCNRRRRVRHRKQRRASVAVLRS